MNIEKMDAKDRSIAFNIFKLYDSVTISSFL